MKNQIHSTSIVHPKAKLGRDVIVGPYSVIGPNVTLGDYVEVGSFCVIDGNTTIGKGCQFFTGAVIGSIPQDKKFTGKETTYLEIGENNVFREYATMNLGTGEGGKTIIGNNNLLMANAHVAHDCLVGSHCVIANCGALAGHVTMEDNVVIGGLTAIHQFVRLGKFSIVGGCSKVVQDIPPFSTCDGHPAKVFGINSVGLKRAKFSFSTMQNLKKAFKILFFSELSKPHALEQVSKEISSFPELEHLIAFIKSSTRGLCS